MDEPKPGGWSHDQPVPLLSPINRLRHGTAIPHAYTSFVGRDDESAQVASLLRNPGVRLVTLTGPGGVGKTRLACRVAEELESEFPNGVAFVDLSAITDPGQVASTVANALGIHETSREAVASALTRALRGQLLVLDNFEQVVDASPWIAQLLSASQTTILVTSRESLHLSAERVVNLLPLPLPKASLTGHELLDDTAIRLFADRAQAVRNDFRLTPASSPIIADIVRQLDGLPLAIELAAARIEHFSLPALRDRLKQRLPILTGGPRDHPQRQRTLRDAIAWSFDLLSAPEQSLLCQLATFVDGWTIEAAEAVCVIEDQPDEDILNVLTSLLSKSLLRYEYTATGQVRYRMLETVREFALGKPMAMDQRARWRTAHASYYLQLAEHNQHAKFHPDGLHSMTSFAAEHANARAALEWFLETGDNERLLLLAASTGVYWVDLGNYREGQHWLTLALSRNPTHAPARARALISLGMIELYLSLPHQAEPRLREALRIGTSTDDGFTVTRALLGLGAVASLAGNLDEATTHFEAMIDVARGFDDPQLTRIMEGWALINLADISRNQHDRDLAMQRLTIALEHMRRSEYVVGEVMALGDLGDLARDVGNHQLAQQWYQQAVVAGDAEVRVAVINYVVESIGVNAIADGRADVGVRVLGAAESLRQLSGLRHRVSNNAIAFEQAIANARATLGDAEFEAAWAIGQATRPDQSITDTLKRLESDPQSMLPQLTRREREILTLLARGMSNLAIAEALFISVRTAENHVAHILTKLGVSSRAAAVDIAHQTGFVSP